MEEEYSFDVVNAGTVGKLTLATDNVTVSTDGARFTIEEGSSNVCKWCGGQHDGGFVQSIIGFFHKVLAAILGAKY